MGQTDLARLRLGTTADNCEVVARASMIILAVKPKQLRDVLGEIAPSLRADGHLLISVVTGVSLQDIMQIVPPTLPTLRAMPNTAIAIQESMTCLATRNASVEQKQWVQQLFDALGKSIYIDEDLMNAATVLGACGIAYAMRYIRAASQGGIEIGFGAEAAHLIAAQTVKGAAALLLQRGLHPEAEIDKVTTPQGCTIVGLNEMEHRGFSSALIKGVTASYRKIDNIEEDAKR